MLSFIVVIMCDLCTEILLFVYIYFRIGDPIKLLLYSFVDISLIVDHDFTFSFHDNSFKKNT